MTWVALTFAEPGADPEQSNPADTKPSENNAVFSSHVACSSRIILGKTSSTGYTANVPIAFASTRSDSQIEITVLGYQQLLWLQSLTLLLWL